MELRYIEHKVRIKDLRSSFITFLSLVKENILSVSRKYLAQDKGSNLWQ